MLCPQSALTGAANVVVVTGVDGDQLYAGSLYSLRHADIAAGFTSGPLTGTSFAAPRVAGKIAAAHPTLSPAQLKLAILASVGVVPGLQDKVRSGGALDPAGAELLGTCFSKLGPLVRGDLAARCLPRTGAPQDLISKKLDLLTAPGVIQ